MTIIATSRVFEVIQGHMALVWSWAYHYFGMVTPHGRLVRWFVW